MQSKVLHSSTCKLLYHLLCIRWLAEWYHVTSISHNQQVQVVSLGEVANHLLPIIVVYMAVSTAGTRSV